MAQKYTAIPVLNPIQFYKEGKELPSVYHKKHLDEGFSLAGSLTYENKVDYAQPWQINDLISVQVRTHVGAVNNNEVLLDILDLDGNVLINGIAPQYYDTFTDDVVNGLQVWYYQFKTTWSTYAAYIPQTGTNYVRFRLRLIEDGPGTSGPETEVWLSEIQQFKPEQPGTLLVEYSNSENDFDTVFEQVSPLFCVRVEGDVHSREPGSTTTAYTDMGDELVQLSSVPYDIDKLSIQGVPDYMVKKLNHILACDRVRIDNKLYVKEDGAKFELQTTTNHPLKGASIQLRPADNKHVSDNYETSFALWPQGDSTYPKYLSDVGIFDGVRFLRIKAVVLENSAAGTTLAATLSNGANSAANGTAGSFSYTDHALVYSRGTGESWTSYTSFVFTAKFSLSVTVNIADGILGWKDKLFNYGIDWGDGTVENKLTANPFNPPTEIVQHRYANTGSYTVRIFHPGTSYCYFNYPSDSNNAASCTITDISGSLPEQTYQFFINGNDGVSADLGSMSNGSDWDFLRPAAANITNIILYKARISADIGQVFLGQPIGKKYQALSGITLTGNQLSVAQVTNVVLNFYGYTSGYANAGGVMRLKQDPAAVIVNSAALGYINNMTSIFQWTVEKD